jgi:hypothetical protein
MLRNEEEELEEKMSEMDRKKGITSGVTTHESRKAGNESRKLGFGSFDPNFG